MSPIILYNLKEVTDGFDSQESCVNWCNKVAPLLKLANEQYYINFLQNAHKLSLPLSSYTLGPALRIARNQLAMAIEELKLKIENNIGSDDCAPAEKIEKIYKQKEKNSKHNFSIGKAIASFFKLIGSLGIVSISLVLWINSAYLTISLEMPPHFQQNGDKFFFYLKNSNFFSAKIVKGYMAVVSYNDSQSSSKKLYLFESIKYDRDINRDDTEPVIITLKNKLPVESFTDHVHLLMLLYYRPFAFLPFGTKKLEAIFYYNPKGFWVKQPYSIKPEIFDEVFKALHSGKIPFK